MHWIIICGCTSDEWITLVATANNKCECKKEEMTKESEFHRGNNNK
jgi:hypothetical protein